MKNKTAAISVRIDAELKRVFFKYLDRKGMTFSKWLRRQMIQAMLPEGQVVFEAEFTDED